MSFVEWGVLVHCDFLSSCLGEGWMHRARREISIGSFLRASCTSILRGLPTQTTGAWESPQQYCTSTSAKTCNSISYYVITISVMALAWDAVSAENESDSRKNPGSRILPIRLSTLASQKRAAARSHDEAWT